MNVIPMMNEIHCIANPVIGEPGLPNLLVAANDRSEFMRVCAFDQLYCAFNRHIGRGRQKQVNMLGHRDEGMHAVTAFATIAVKRLQENPHIDFDDEQFSAVESREGHEIGTGRGDESSRFQSEPQRLKAAATSELRPARVLLVPISRAFRFGFSR